VPDRGPQCTVKVLLQVLFYAAGHLCTVFAACNPLTADIVRWGQRFTGALLRGEPGTPTVEVLKGLLHLARQAGTRPPLLLLDRGFGSRAVIGYLYQARYPFVRPVVRPGRSLDDPRGPSRIQVFAPIKRGGWHTSTLTKADKPTATVRICVHCRNWPGWRGRPGRHPRV
jgi:hypothetical protein